MYFYPRLGKNGRLGNQMFQYATLLSLSKYHGVEAGIPENKGNVDDDYGYAHIYDAFENLSATLVTSADMSSAKYEYNAKEGIDFNFDPSLFSTRDDCRINGYFQSELYFSMIRDDLKKEFKFSDEIIGWCKNKLQDLRPNADSTMCAVHFRRGDYSGLGNVHTNLGSDYYNPAISWMTDNLPDCRFIAFSDDIQWCKDNLPEGFLFAETPGMFYDMCMMSMCDSHIIANSSFSWWGAWLSDCTKQVIAPRKWFGPDGPKSWDTIYCNGWGVI